MPAVPRRPLEILNAFVVLVLLVLTFYGATTGRFTTWQHWAVRYGAMLLFVCAMAWGVAWGRRRGGGLPWPLLILVNFYALWFVPEIFNSVGYVIPSVNPHMRDDWLIAFDRWLFGFDPTLALQRFITPRFVDVMY